MGGARLNRNRVYLEAGWNLLRRVLHREILVDRFRKFGRRRGRGLGSTGKGLDANVFIVRQSFDSLDEWDHRRFRINLLLDGAGEDELTGDVTVGEATIRIRRPIERCVMVTRAQPGIPKDVSVLKRVIGERNNQLGVGAIVTTPGTVSVGDELVSSG